MIRALGDLNVDVTVSRSDRSPKSKCNQVLPGDKTGLYLGNPSSIEVHCDTLHHDPIAALRNKLHPFRNDPLKDVVIHLLFR
jgi:hypothetical protein